MSLPTRKAPPSSGHLRAHNGQRSASLASAPLIPEQFKESFTLLDKDADGTISASDLSAMWTSLGTTKSPSQVSEMMTLVPAPLTFPAYFTAMTSLMSDISSREELLAALSAFDEEDSGKLEVRELLDALTTGRDSMDEEHAQSVVKAFTRNGKFNYNAFVESIAGAA